MSPSDWVSLSGVAVALGLGLYGTFRGRQDRRDARALRERAQAERVIAYRDFDHALDEHVLIVRNMSTLPIRSLSAPSVSWDEGDASASTQHHSVLDPGDLWCIEIPHRDRPHLPSPLWVDFEDAEGRAWRRAADGSLVRS